MNSLSLSYGFGNSGDSQRVLVVSKKRYLDHSAALSTIPYIEVVSNGFGILIFL